MLDTDSSWVVGTCTGTLKCCRWCETDRLVGLCDVCFLTCYTVHRRPFRHFKKFTYLDHTFWKPRSGNHSRIRMTRAVTPPPLLTGPAARRARRKQPRRRLTTPRPRILPRKVLSASGWQAVARSPLITKINKKKRSVILAVSPLLCVKLNGNHEGIITGYVGGGGGVSLGISVSYLKGLSHEMDLAKSIFW
jgi:hypothetical protein